MSNEHEQPMEQGNLQEEPKRLNRREFVRTAGATAAAGALMAGLSSGVSAQSTGQNSTFLPLVSGGGDATQQQTQQVAAAAQGMPNILLVLVDQERFPIFADNNDNEFWPTGFNPDQELWWHTFLRNNGVTFTNYHTSTALCTPSRSVIYTGQHVPKTGMFDNHSMPYIGDMNCNPDELPTIGHMLSEVGYYTAYKGKWHLSDTEPCGDTSERALEKYGFFDYNVDGDKGNPREGYTDDDNIASDAVSWLDNTARNLNQPWFLAVNFTNPHDVMYYDPDDTSYTGLPAPGNHTVDLPGDKLDELVPTYDVIQGLEPFNNEGFAGVMNYDPTGLEDPGNSVVGIYRTPLGQVLNKIDGTPFTELVPSFDDPVDNQVAAHLEFDKLNDALYVPLSPDTDQILYERRLNYYINCIRDVDRHLGTVLQGVNAAGFRQNTIVIYTADHGEHCGAHGLVTKGPTMYKENFRCPLIVARAGLNNAGASTDGLVTAVDLIPSILSGIGIADWQTRWPGLKGREDIRRLVANPVAPAQRGRSNQRGIGTLFTWDAISHNDGASKDGTSPLGKLPDFRKRGQVRGVFDGRYKFGRYFSALNYQRPTTLQDLLDNNDLELYDTWNDPTEINNLADPNNPAYDTNLILEMNDKLNLLLENEVGPESQDQGRFLPFPRAEDLFRVGG